MKEDGPILDLVLLELREWIERGQDCEVGASEVEGAGFRIARKRESEHLIDDDRSDTGTPVGPWNARPATIGRWNALGGRPDIPRRLDAAVAPRLVPCSAAVR